MCIKDGVALKTVLPPDGTYTGHAGCQSHIDQAKTGALIPLGTEELRGWHGLPRPEAEAT